MPQPITSFKFAASLLENRAVCLSISCFIPFLVAIGFFFPATLANSSFLIAGLCSYPSGILSLATNLRNRIVFFLIFISRQPTLISRR